MDTTTITLDPISQNNCTGNAEVESQFQKSHTIQHVLEAQGGFSVNSNGQLGFAGTDIELGATVAAELGYTYGTEDTITRSITVKAKPGTNMQHLIKQVEVWKIGEAKVSVGNQSTTVPFRFLQDFSVELEESRDLNDCDDPLLPASDESQQSISDGCISSATWSVASTNDNALEEVSTSASGCYKAESLGIFADNDGVLHLNMRERKDAISSGIYTPVNNNSVITFNVYVNSMYIIYPEVPVMINFAVAPADDIMTAKNTARFKLHVEDKANTPRVYFFMADVGEYNGIKVDTRHYEYGRTYTVRLELVGNIMRVFVNDIKMNEDLLIPTGQKAFYIGYNIPVIAGVDVEINNIMIDNISK